MLSKSWIERSSYTEMPSVRPVNLQVRTGVSAPFEPHMTGDVPPTSTPLSSTVHVPAATFMTGSTG